MYFDLPNQRVRIDEERADTGRLATFLIYPTKTYTFSTVLPASFAAAAAQGVNVTEADKQLAMIPVTCERENSTFPDVSADAFTSSSVSPFVARINNVNHWKIAGVDFTEDAATRQPLTLAGMNVASYVDSVSSTLFVIPAACASAQDAKEIQERLEKHIYGDFANRHAPDSSVQLQSDSVFQARLPGTHWCGKGNDCKSTDANCCNSRASSCSSAVKYGCEALNPTDACCRQHDFCPYEGTSGSTMTCHCDKRIYDCVNGLSYDWLIRAVFWDYNVFWPCNSWDNVCVRRYWFGLCRSYATQWTSRSWNKYSGMNNKGLGVGFYKGVDAGAVNSNDRSCYIG